MDDVSFWKIRERGGSIFVEKLAGFVAIAENCLDRCVGKQSSNI